MRLKDRTKGNGSAFLCMMVAVSVLAFAGCKGGTDAGAGTEPTTGAAGSDTNTPATNAPPAPAETNTATGTQ